MFLRMGLRPVLVCCALFAFTGLASAQAKVAVINLQRAVFECAEIKKADADMQAKFKPRQDAVEKLQADIANLAKQLQNAQGKLSAQAEAELTSQGQRKQRELQRLQDDLQADATSYRNDVLSRSSSKM